MAAQLSDKLTSGDLWKRFLYMVLFAIAYAVAKLVFTVVVIFQFLAILFTGHATEPLLKFGNNLSLYFAQLIRFQTFNTEEKPVPFSDWLDEEIGPNIWVDGDEDSLEEVVEDSAVDESRAEEEAPEESSEDNNTPEGEDKQES
jgi:hypothetical protein